MPDGVAQHVLVAISRGCMLVSPRQNRQGSYLTSLHNVPTCPYMGPVTRTMRFIQGRSESVPESESEPESTMKHRLRSRSRLRPKPCRLRSPVFVILTFH